MSVFMDQKNSEWRHYQWPQLHFLAKGENFNFIFDNKIFIMIMMICGGCADKKLYISYALYWHCTAHPLCAESMTKVAFMMFLPQV